MIATILGIETGYWYSDIFVLTCGIVGAVMVAYGSLLIIQDWWPIIKAEYEDRHKTS